MNNIDKNFAADEQQKPERIYTKVKFTRSELTGEPVGFVMRNKTTGEIRGVRQDSQCLKKICVVDKSLKSQVLLNTLYNCTLVPMTNRESGYVVIDLQPVQFRAEISSRYIKGNMYLVEVKFGNKVVTFNPFSGRKDSVRNLAECRAVLEKRVDIEDVTEVVKDFERSANIIVMLMEKDMYRSHKL